MRSRVRPNRESRSYSVIDFSPRVSALTVFSLVQCVMQIADYPKERKTREIPVIAWPAASYKRNIIDRIIDALH